RSGAGRRVATPPHRGGYTRFSDPDRGRGGERPASAGAGADRGDQAPDPRPGAQHPQPGSPFFNAGSVPATAATAGGTYSPNPAESRLLKRPDSRRGT